MIQPPRRSLARGVVSPPSTHSGQNCSSIFEYVFWFPFSLAKNKFMEIWRRDDIASGALPGSVVRISTSTDPRDAWPVLLHTSTSDK